jgi:translation initiation factor eIF-2B subunit gamma
VGTECVVGEGTSIGAKCSIKKSIIGRRCNIGNNVKIVNSVIMDFVTIKEGYNIQFSQKQPKALPRDFFRSF